MTTIQVPLSDELARAAEQEGLLQPEALAELIREAIRRKAGKKLLELTGSAVEIDAMPEAEVTDFVQNVIAGARADKRENNARSA